MRLNDMFPSKYLKAADLNGEEMILTIKDVVMEQLGQEGEKENKAVVYFQEEDKGLVLNVTNGNTIGSLLGDDTDKWAGKKIKLITAEVAFKGKMTLSIRVSGIKVVQGKTMATKKPVAVENQTEDATDDIKY